MSATNETDGRAGRACSAAVIVAEGYYRIKAEHERLKELCVIVEPWAAHHACNNRSVSPLADQVYKACVEMRRIIYSPNAKRERPEGSGQVSMPDATADLPLTAVSVFEAVDVTGDDVYWSLGVWLTLEEAMGAFNECNDPSDFGCHDHDDRDDCCEVEIRERKIGWSSDGKVRATLRWVNRYDEANDEMVWNREPTNSTDKP